MLHEENRRINSKDRFFVLGGNPDNSGGGVIESFNDLSQANALRDEALKQGYTRVIVRTWEEMMEN